MKSDETDKRYEILSLSPAITKKMVVVQALFSNSRFRWKLSE